MDKNIVAQDEIFYHLIDVTKLHKAHFKSVKDKVETLATTLVTLIQIDKVHFFKITSFCSYNFPLPSTSVNASFTRLVTTDYHQELYNMMRRSQL